MMNNKSLFIYFVCALAVLMLMSAACSSPIPQDSMLEKNWGRSYETQLRLQTLHPDAGKRAGTVMVMDGAASDHVMDVYLKSFNPEKKKQTVNIIKLK